MATAACRALRQHFPEAQIVAVAKPYVAGVVAAAPWFNEQLAESRFLPLQRALRARKIDLAILFPNSFRTSLLAWLGGCRRRVGFARYLRSWMLTDVLRAPRDERGRLVPYPALDSYNALVRQVGCPDPGTRLELYTGVEAEEAAERVWSLAGFRPEETVIGLNPGAAFGAAKCWPTAHWVDLAKRLLQVRNCRLLVLGGPAERALSREIAAGVGSTRVSALADLTTPVHDAGPALSLGLSMALVRRLSLLVTTDSGPRHFAAAFQRPVVTLFGPTHIAWTETYHPQALHLQKALPCGPCQQRVCPQGHHRCMKELLPEDVLQACQRLLASPLRSAAG